MFVRSLESWSCAVCVACRQSMRWYLASMLSQLLESHTRCSHLMCSLYICLYICYVYNVIYIYIMLYILLCLYMLYVVYMFSVVYVCGRGGPICFISVSLERNSVHRKMPRLFIPRLNCWDGRFKRKRLLKTFLLNSLRILSAQLCPANCPVVSCYTSGSLWISDDSVWCFQYCSVWVLQVGCSCLLLHGSIASLLTRQCSFIGFSAWSLSVPT